MSKSTASAELTPEKQALLALRKLRARVDELERARSESIAIVGAGCRLPGGATTPEAFWTVLQQRVDAVSEVPRGRWDVDAFYDPDPDAPGKMYTRRSGFLSSIDMFDPRHFGITPREAMSMDPQQRLLLEVTWEALERAGQAPDRLAGSETGVFVGISTNDYGQLLLRALDQIDPGMYFGTGNLLNAAAGRLSYVLGLQGPSMAVDTACSSSLVAVHLACQSLRNRECSMALAGGSNLVLVPEVTVNCCRAKMLAPDGRCKTFDAAADGYVRGEGCAVVVLKRLSDAAADGDRILALIRGSAVNQDGRSGGFTAPNELAQQAVIRAALRAGGVVPADVDYVEAHGTGTSLGDPIEIHAIAAALGEGRPVDRPLVVGSVKTNVGHLEAAAGITGLIKVVLALEHQEIPPHLHFQRLNPRIDVGGFPLEIPCDARPWVRNERPRLAGVSSFGFTGTNAHVILQEAPAVAPRDGFRDRPAHVLVLSARTEAALRETAARYCVHLASAGASLGDVCFTAARGRAAFDHRLAVVTATTDEARERLAEAAAGSTSRVRAAKVRTSDEGVVFLFTGQGSQYVDMGRELYEGEPVFRASIDRCDDILRGHLERPLRSALYPATDERSPIDETAYTQPALFAVGFALAELWRAWGVQPSAVVGHSVGEYTAACVAGALPLDEALRLVAARGRLMQQLPPNGAMAAVMAGEGRVREAIAGAVGRVAIAALNGPAHTVIAGESVAVAAIVEALAADGITAKRLTVSHAFHSPLVEPMLAEFEGLAAAVPYRPLQVPFVSNLTGQFVASDFAFDAAYWRRHAGEAVRFADGISAAYARGDRVFLEIGPSPMLTAMAQQVVGGSDASWIASIRRGRSDWRQMLEAVAELFVRGVPIDWAGFDRPYQRRKVDLPTYPFQRERYWIDVAPSSPASSPADRPRAAAAGMLYVPRWVAQDEDAVRWAPAGGRRLVVADRSPLAAWIRDAFERAGDACVLAGPPSTVVEWQTLLSGSPRGYDSVLFVTGHDEADDASHGEGVCGSIARLVQATRSPSSPSPRLFIITADAQPAGEVQRLSMAAAPIWGFARVLALEHPQIWGGLIDLTSETSPEGALQIVQHVRGPQTDDQVAFRRGRRFVARLERLAPAGVVPLQLKGDATYVITGGLGSLGLSLAGRLVACGARSIALIGRSGLPPRGAWDGVSPNTSAARRIAAVLELERTGAAVHVCKADVSDRDAVQRVFSSLALLGPPVRGIVHAAGVSRPTAIVEMTAEILADTFRAKAAGAACLHDATRDLSLEFFVLFSSISSVWGSRSLGAYAAANHYLDALAHKRHALGLPALSVNWGPWSGSGMMDDAGEQWLASIGVRALVPEQALDALECLMSSGEPQAVVADVDWATFLPVYEAKGTRPLMERLRPADQPAGTDSRDPGAVERLSRLLPLERRVEIVRLVADHVMQVIGTAQSGAVGLDEGLFDMGMDSLMATELRRRLEREFARNFPPTFTFDYPRINQLAEFIDRECFSSAPEAAAPDAQASAAVPADLAAAVAVLESLPDDEAEVLLTNRGGRSTPR